MGNTSYVRSSFLIKTVFSSPSPHPSRAAYKKPLLLTNSEILRRKQGHCLISWTIIDLLVAEIRGASGEPIKSSPFFVYRH
jgi:hypothetical protein